MGTVIIILLILLFIGFIYLQHHPELLIKWLARRVMPPEMREQMKHQQRRQQSSKTQKGPKAFWTRRPASPPPAHEPIIPKEYAQDVEFTESHTYSSDININETSADGSKTHTHIKQEITVESQVSDAEWEEIK